jgi:histone deacetylase 1/2
MVAKDRICYYYDEEVGRNYYGPNHPMKPHRLCMTHDLVLAYDLHKHLQVYRPRASTDEEFMQFHSEDYISFLTKITPDKQHQYVSEMQKFNLGEDCPIFDHMVDFCRRYTGGSIDGATRLNLQLSDIAINWSGGLHHAKKTEASGFCYVNDLVLAILELLKQHARVLYIDIDIHHGDGVEEAFYITDRVMTVSFHKYGDMFFPGTGALQDVGLNSGKYYSVNVPLSDGVDDVTFVDLFKFVMRDVMDMFQPGAIVLQCGADSLAGDRIGCFNLSLQGHSDCVAFMKSFKKPILVTGGGGYTKSNVARCWANETATLLGKSLAEDIPPHKSYYEYYADADYKLKAHAPVWIENQNSPQQIEKLKAQVRRNLRSLNFAPSVEFTEAPPDGLVPELDENALKPDERFGGTVGRDSLRDHDSEFYDEE